MVFHEVHVLDGPEGLLRVVLVVGLDVPHPKQGDAGVGAVTPKLREVGAENQNFVLLHQLGAGGDADEIHGGLAAAAQLIGGVPQHYQLKGAGVLPGPLGVIGAAPGGGGAGQLLHLADDRIIQLHQNLMSTFFRSKILFTCT